MKQKLHNILISITLIMIIIKTTWAFWPPAYKIHLNHSETFIISDMFDEYDDEDFSAEDEEIIKRAEVEKFLGANRPKFYRIHKIAGRRNRAAAASLTFQPEKPTEMPYDKQDYPEYAGFVNNNSEIDTNENVYYANEKAKASVENKIKELRKEKGMLRKEQEEDYDFGAYKKEYADFVKKEEKSKNVLKYTDIPEEESVKDSIKNILTFRNVTNCTAEEIKGIGYSSIKCFYYDLSHPKNVKNKEGLMKRFLKLVIIWFLVYVSIAIPCWCMKGWCCCCFRCKFCRPIERIDEVKKFVADNPLGVLRLDEKVVTYEPTIYEEHAQKRLEQALMKLV